MNTNVKECVDDELRTAANQCNCTKVLANIAEELDRQYELTQDNTVSREALLFYKQMYSNALALFDTVGFEVIRSQDNGKHTVKFKTNRGIKTNVFE